MSVQEMFPEGRPEGDGGQLYDLASILSSNPKTQVLGVSSDDARGERVMFGFQGRDTDVDQVFGASFERLEDLRELAGETLGQQGLAERVHGYIEAASNMHPVPKDQVLLGMPGGPVDAGDGQAFDFV